MEQAGHMGRPPPAAPSTEGRPSGWARTEVNLVRDWRGNLYGTTSKGGAANIGTVFELTSKGIYTILHRFTDNEGAFPAGGLKLYGNVSMA